MSKHRIVKSDFWVDKYVENLLTDERYLFLYLLTNPNTNILGIYQSTLKRIGFETGLEIDIIEKILNKFSSDDKVHYIDDYILMVNFQKHQVPNKTMLKGIEKLFSSLPVSVVNFILSKKSIIYDRLSKTIKGYVYPRKDKDINKDKSKGKDVEISGEEIPQGALEFLRDGSIQPQVFFQSYPCAELDSDANEIIGKIFITQNPNSKRKLDPYQVSVIKKYLILGGDLENLNNSIKGAKLNDDRSKSDFEVSKLTADYITNPRNQARLVGSWDIENNNQQSRPKRSTLVD